jgi:hypothetical protein
MLRLFNMAINQFHQARSALHGVLKTVEALHKECSGGSLGT